MHTKNIADMVKESLQVFFTEEISETELAEILGELQYMLCMFITKNMCEMHKGKIEPSEMLFYINKLHTALVA